MTLMEIMRDKERVLKGELFKRKIHNFKIKWDEKVGFVYEDRNTRYMFSPDDFLANDWEWVKEKWYEGNLKEKYPNGVLCEAWNGDSKFIVVIVDYDNTNKLFIDSQKWGWIGAKPIKRKDAPAIIDENELEK